MKTLSRHTLMTLAVTVTLSGCSSDDHAPASDPDHIGLQKNICGFHGNGGEKEFSTMVDGWSLSEVVVTECDSVYYGDSETYHSVGRLLAIGTTYDTQFFQPEIEADEPFEYTVNRLTFNYSDRKIKLVAASRDSSDRDHEFLYEFILRKGDSTEKIYCCHSSVFLNPPVIVVTPAYFIIPAEGGTFTADITLNYGSDGWQLNQLFVSGYEGWVTGIGLSVKPGDSWSRDFLWLSLETNDPKTLRITAQPNKTGKPRSFRFYLENGYNRTEIGGEQESI